MSVEEIKQLATTTQKRIGLVYALILAGLMIEMVVLAVGAFLGLSAGDFWGSTKAVRDSATAGSTLLATGGRVAAVSAWLEPFKFVGLALLFSGIGLALSAIIPRIQLRAQTMATVIPQIKQRAQG